MDRKLKSVFGLVLIAAGVIAVLLVTGIINFTFSLDGWWTFFIIIPCLGKLLTGKDVVGSFIGLGIGVLLLLAARSIIAWNQIWMLLLAVVLIGVGINLLFNLDCAGCHHPVQMACLTENGRQVRHIENSFGQQKLSFDGECIEGMTVKTSFGDLSLDLRNAIINDDIDIKVEVAFGGLDIYVPEGYVVKKAVSTGFGGVSDKRNNNESSGKPVIFLSGSCGFAGITIR